MSTDETKVAPPELDYILQSCRAVAERRYADALFLLKEGLRENVGVAERINSLELITLLRALVTIIESNAEEDFGIRLPEAEDGIQRP